jgi:hypothetical protein
MNKNRKHNFKNIIYKFNSFIENQDRIIYFFMHITTIILYRMLFND